MKTLHILSASALALLAAGLHAETYEGVQAPVSVMSRDAVYADAVRTAAAADQNIPVSYTHLTLPTKRIV